MKPVSPKTHMLILSQTKELTIRRLRGFGATLGAKVQLFTSVEDLVRGLIVLLPSLSSDDPKPLLVLDEAISEVGASELLRWSLRCQLVVTEKSHKDLDRWLHPDGASIKPSAFRATENGSLASLGQQVEQHWSLHIDKPLAHLIDFPMLQAALLKTCIRPGPVDFSLLLRWGFVSFHCKDKTTNRKYSGKTQRLPSEEILHIAGMFTHHVGLNKGRSDTILAIANTLAAYAKEPSSKLSHTVFASDGLWSMVSVKVEKGPSPFDPKWWRAQLSQSGCHMILLSQAKDGSGQVTALMSQIDAPELEPLKGSAACIVMAEKDPSSIQIGSLEKLNVAS